MNSSLNRAFGNYKKQELNVKLPVVFAPGEAVFGQRQANNKSVVWQLTYLCLTMVCLKSVNFVHRFVGEAQTNF
jgi:hypothetical protein